MKKRINGKKNYIYKKVVYFIIILIFLLFICSALILSKRRYLYVERGFKTLSSVVNTYFIKVLYPNNNLSKNVTNALYESKVKENNELRKMLDLKEKNTSLIAAEVTNNTSKTWFQIITINKGYKDGIKKDLPVISSNGLVGFVSKTSKSVSEVKLLTSVSDDNMLSVLIELSGEDISGVLSGYDSKTGLFKVTDIMSKSKINVGDKVVLSGYGNYLYKGIYIGEVVKEEISNHGLSKTVWVSSNVNFDDILFTLVVADGGGKE